MPLGILCGAFVSASRLSEPFVDFVRYMPAPAFIPLLIIYFGLEELPKILLIFIGTFFFNTLMIMDAVKFVPSELVETALTLGGRGLPILTRVVAPFIAPQVLDTYRINMASAWNLVIVADIWHSVPFIALILQAALATIPAEMEEAAMVDGASAWQRFTRIRLPMLRPAILVALVVRTVEAFRVFDILYVITQGGPAFGTVTISYLTYLESFTYGHLGSGAALSFLISAFTLVMALIYIRFLYRPEALR
ncbi:MAG: ABC transporter permease subunit [Chloroflexota bacterium]